MMSRKTVLAALLGFAIAVTPTLATAQTKPPATKLALAFIGWNTTSNWPGLIGQQKGFFLEEGLDIDWITTGQSAKAAQQVMAGVTPLGSSSTVDTLRAIDGGGDLQIFMN